MTIKELIAVLEEKIGKRAEVVFHPKHPADMITSQADVSKAKLLLDWDPQVSLEEGIGKVVEWYLKEQSWAKDIKTD